MKGAALLEKQSGIIKALLELTKHEEIMLTELQWNAGLHPHVCNRAVKRLIDIELVEEDYRPPRRMLKLTEKGKKVAELLQEIDYVMRKS